jgi:hypothetical protein
MIIFSDDFQATCIYQPEDFVADLAKAENAASFSSIANRD